MRDIDDLFRALASSAFRQRFRLVPREQSYLRAKTLPLVLEHARDFIDQRLAPREPPNDGKQTPFRAIRSSSPSMRQRPAAAPVWPNGTASPPAANSTKPNAPTCSRSSSAG